MVHAPAIKKTYSCQVDTFSIISNKIGSFIKFPKGQKNVLPIVSFWCMWHIDFMHTENIKCFYAETNDETSEQRKKNRIITKWCFIWQTPVCGANKQKIFYCGLNSMKHENSVHDRCLCMGIFSPYSYAFNLCIVYGWIYKFCVFRLPHEFESPVQRNDNNNN